RDCAVRHVHSFPTRRSSDLSSWPRALALDDDQLAWLATHGRIEERRAGEGVFTQGEPATCFFVLLEGTVVMRRRVEGSEVEISRDRKSTRLNSSHVKISYAV